MSQIILNLDGEALKEAAIAAMLGELSPEARKQIVDQAVRNAMTEQSGYGRSNSSPFQHAFNQAVVGLANKLAVEMVGQDDALRERLRDLLRQTADKILQCDVDKLAERMADALVSSMRRD